MKKIIENIEVEKAYKNIYGQVNHTPIISSSLLNEFLNHEIFFKVESLQKTGAYKIRGILNTLISLQKQNNLPKKIVAYSTGNHGLALAWATKKFGIDFELFMPEFTSKVKQRIAEYYGAKLFLTATRAETEAQSIDAANKPGVLWVPPSDMDSIIAGAGTVVYESLKDLQNIDAIFAPIGGGGLCAGSYLAKEMLNPKAKLFGCEPIQANDAARSYNSGEIFRFESSPETIADGVRTLGITPKLFEYIKKLDGIIEISEREILYWTAWFIHLLKNICEPTAALSMAGAFRWLKNNETKKRVLVIISGGNMDETTHQTVWAKNPLQTLPNEFNFDTE